MADMFDSLNERQMQAVFQTEGPVLILAGAGSGKTRVLTYRMAYLIQELQVPAYQIVAITFTNKAAKEMRERVDKLIGPEAQDAWISTFHSFCLRLLRKHSDVLGFHSGFTIYDPEDQKSLVRKLLKDMNLDEKVYTPKAVLSAISAAKNELQDPDEYARAVRGDFTKDVIVRIYGQYQERMLANQAMDFDDILVYAVKLLAENPSILEYYQNKFRYLMVDEYQDTNTAQYRLVHLLSRKHHNLCVVGDDDQSIYKFRGACIRNILDFEDDFPDATVIRLEENYRSTGTILHAANEVIRHNASRKSKTLWTQHPMGEKIKVLSHDDESAEAAYIAAEMIRLHNQGKNYHDMAVLFRTNSQSRALEEALLYKSIPYRLYAGVPFYQRKEIKDLLCYLRLIVNDSDYLAAARILNVPKRGLGETTSERLQMVSSNAGKGIVETIDEVEKYPELARAGAKLKTFADIIRHFREEAASEDASLSDLLENLITMIGYENYLKEEDPDKIEERQENIEELKNRLEAYEEEADEPTLAGLIEELSLVAAIDSLEEGVDAVALMTLHSAKGLEFPVVFMAGMEDGLFPSYMSISSGEEDDIEEERRLCYVGITRAQELLYMTWARSRRIRGMQELSKISRFMKELPEDAVEMVKPLTRPTYGSAAQQKSTAQFGAASKSKGYGYGFGPVHSVSAANPFTSGNDRTRSSAERTGGNSSSRLMGSASSSGYSARSSNGNFGKTGSVQLSVGDTVSHVKFGLGIVKEVQPLNADAQVTVEFAKFGTKKLLAGLAKLKKV